MNATAFGTRNRPYELIVFDTREPGAAERLASERAAWRESATVEPLGPGHAALIVCAGGASRSAEGRAA